MAPGRPSRLVHGGPLRSQSRATARSSRGDEASREAPPQDHRVRPSRYRYESDGADRFLPHYDEVWPGSRLSVAADGEPTLEQDRMCMCMLHVHVHVHRALLVCTCTCTYARRSDVHVRVHACRTAGGTPRQLRPEIPTATAGHGRPVIVSPSSQSYST